MTGLGFWRRTSTSARLAMVGMGATILYGAAAGFAPSLGPPVSGAPAGWLLVIQMTLPLLVIEALVAMGLRSRTSIHILGVIGAGLLAVGAVGEGVMQTVVVTAEMVGGTVPGSVGPVVLLAAVVLGFVGADFVLAAVAGWRETRRDARSSSKSTLGPAA